jgi:hypothetical protein
MRVKVWNDNDYPFTDNDFYGDKVTVPAKSFIYMERDKAIDFKGKYQAPKIDGGGQFLPESFKRIRVEEVNLSSNEKKPSDDLKCQACGKEFNSEKELLAHIRADHMNQWADETKEEMEKKEPRKRIGGKFAKKDEEVPSAP